MRQKMNSYDDLPWAASYVGPAARHLTVEEARLAFGECYDHQATYICSGDGYARRVVTEDDAIANGLTSIFTGALCQNGHIAPRKLRKNSTPECMDCRRQAKRRARRKKQAPLAA